MHLQFVIVSSCRFVYGGLNTDHWEGYGEVYRPTIPGFSWFQAGSTPHRVFNILVKLLWVDKLISIGWLEKGEILISQRLAAPRPIQPGHQLFDMTDMIWLSAYDKNATTYQSPDGVKDWYS